MVMRRIFFQILYHASFYMHKYRILAIRRRFQINHFKYTIIYFIFLITAIL